MSLPRFENMPSRMRTALELHGELIVVTRADRIWHVQVGEKGPASSRYLDVALAIALPSMRQRDRDVLLLRLLDWSVGRDEQADRDRAAPDAA